MELKKLLIAAALIAGTLGLAACKDDATTASYNMSKAADNFEILRRVVFVNGITGQYLVELVGLCSITDQKTQLEVICKDGPGDFKKHFLGLSDNTFYVVEQIKGANVSVFHTRITFKPQSIIPNVDFRGDAEELLRHEDTSDSSQ
jgi:hypothetical protein